MYPNTFMLYAASVLVGMGAAILWTAQGNFLTMNSDEDTIGKNSGIFWAMYQCSSVIGNTFVFFQFRNHKDIDATTRYRLYKLFDDRQSYAMKQDFRV